MSKVNQFTEKRVEKWPSDMEPGVLYVDVRMGTPEVVYLLCPCGCGQGSLRLPVGDGVKPHRTAVTAHTWLYRSDKNGPTLEPSIRDVGGCKAHFNITDGQVVWHADSGA